MFAVGGPGEKLARRSLFLAAPGAGILMAQSMLAQAPAGQSIVPAGNPAPATPPAAGLPFKVGVINADAALAGTKDGQKAQTELQTRLGPKYADLKKLNDDIQDLQKRLDQGGNIMSAASKAEIQNNIQTKTRQLQRGQQDFQDEQQKQQSLLLADLYTKMEQVISKYASENGYSLILNVGQENTPVLWVSNQVEITQAIIEAFDKAGPAAPKAAAPAKPAPPSGVKAPSSLSPAAPKAPAAGAPK